MSENAKLLTSDEMRVGYGAFYESSPTAPLDRGNVPAQLWSLVPYAEFWGIADDWSRENLIEQATPEIQRNLKAVVSSFNTDLEAWLAGPEANNRNPSDEYIAFAALVMAADYI